MLTSQRIPSSLIAGYQRQTEMKSPTHHTTDDREQPSITHPGSDRKGYLDERAPMYVGEKGNGMPMKERGGRFTPSSQNAFPPHARQHSSTEELLLTTKDRLQFHESITSPPLTERTNLPTNRKPVEMNGYPDRHSVLAHRSPYDHNERKAPLSPFRRPSSRNEPPNQIAPKYGPTNQIAANKADVAHHDEREGQSTTPREENMSRQPSSTASVVSSGSHHLHPQRSEFEDRYTFSSQHSKVPSRTLSDIPPQARYLYHIPQPVLDESPSISRKNSNDSNSNDRDINNNSDYRGTNKNAAISTGSHNHIRSSNVPVISSESSKSPVLAPSISTMEIEKRSAMYEHHRYDKSSWRSYSPYPETHGDYERQPMSLSKLNMYDRPPSHISPFPPESPYHRSPLPPHPSNGYSPYNDMMPGFQRHPSKQRSDYQTELPNDYRRSYDRYPVVPVKRPRLSGSPPPLHLKPISPGYDADSRYPDEILASPERVVPEHPGIVKRRSAASESSTSHHEPSSPTESTLHCTTSSNSRNADASVPDLLAADTLTTRSPENNLADSNNHAENVEAQIETISRPSENNDAPLIPSDSHKNNLNGTSDESQSSEPAVVILNTESEDTSMYSEKQSDDSNDGVAPESGEESPENNVGIDVVGEFREEYDDDGEGRIGEVDENNNNINEEQSIMNNDDDDDEVFVDDDRRNAPSPSERPSMISDCPSMVSVDRGGMFSDSPSMVSASSMRPNLSNEGGDGEAASSEAGNVATTEKGAVKRGKRKKYQKYSPADRIAIGKYCFEHGPAAARKAFQSRYPEMSESVTRGFRDKYKQMIGEYAVYCFEQKRRREIAERNEALPRGRPRKYKTVDAPTPVEAEPNSSGAHPPMNPTAFQEEARENSPDSPTLVQPSTSLPTSHHMTSSTESINTSSEPIPSSERSPLPSTHTTSSDPRPPSRELENEAGRKDYSREDMLTIGWFSAKHGRDIALRVFSEEHKELTYDKVVEFHSFYLETEGHPNNNQPNTSHHADPERAMMGRPDGPGFQQTVIMRNGDAEEIEDRKPTRRELGSISNNDISISSSRDRYPPTNPLHPRDFPRPMTSSCHSMTSSHARMSPIIHYPKLANNSDSSLGSRENRELMQHDDYAPKMDDMSRDSMAYPYDRYMYSHHSDPVSHPQRPMPRTKRFKYQKYSPEDRFNIGKLCNDIGLGATVKVYREQFPRLNESVVRTFRNKYRELLQKGNGVPVAEAIERKPSRRSITTLIENDVVAKLRQLKESKVELNEKIVLAVAENVISTKNEKEMGLVKNTVTKEWATSLLWKHKLVEKQCSNPNGVCCQRCKTPLVCPKC